MDGEAARVRQRQDRALRAWLRDDDFRAGDFLNLRTVGDADGAEKHDVDMLFSMHLADDQRAFWARQESAISAEREIVAGREFFLRYS